MVVKLPNVQSVVFKEQEGSFLVGAMAAMASKSGKVGFVGGMDIPLIRKFQCGYEQGAKWANPKAEVFGNMTGTTGAAWNDPARGGELAKSQFSKGADVVFAAAGGTGMGVYQAAKDGGKLAIGVDSNQNHIQPGTMLTSMLKRVDVAVYNVSKKFKPGVSSLGLKEGGVDYRHGLQQREAGVGRHEEEGGSRQVPTSSAARSRWPTTWPTTPASTDSLTGASVTVPRCTGHAGDWPATRDGVVGFCLMDAMGSTGV